jgi:hypothetical protein
MQPRKRADVGDEVFVFALPDAADESPALQGAQNRVAEIAVGGGGKNRKKKSDRCQVAGVRFQVKTKHAAENRRKSKAVEPQMNADKRGSGNRERQRRAAKSGCATRSATRGGE